MRTPLISIRRLGPAVWLATFTLAGVTIRLSAGGRWLAIEAALNRIADAHRRDWGRR